MKKLILLCLLSMTFANTDLMFNLILGGGHSHGKHYYHNHGYNHYHYFHRYHPNHMFNQLVWLSYYSNVNKVKKVKKTDSQILNDLQKLYELKEQGAITLKEYNEMKNMMLEELENN